MIESKFAEAVRESFYEEKRQKRLWHCDCLKQSGRILPCANSQTKKDDDSSDENIETIFDGDGFPDSGVNGDVGSETGREKAETEGKSAGDSRAEG